MPNDFDFDEMFDFKLADRANKAARKHVFNGTPLHEAWADVVKAAGPAIGPAVTKVALNLPIAEGLVACTAVYASVLARDNAGPAKKVNGLWFGLTMFGPGDNFEDANWTPYLCGTSKYNPKDRDWASKTTWAPEDSMAHNEPMWALSRLRAKLEEREWYIEVCLIEPLHRLYVSHFARACPLEILLGKNKSRGIGCGMDAGDQLTIGQVDTKGFKPLKTK